MTPARRTGRTPAERVPASTPLPESPARHLDRDACRRRMRALRRAFDGPARANAEHRISASLCDSLWFRNARQIALYRAFDGEVDTRAIEAEARRLGKPVAFARIAHSDAPLVFISPEEWLVRASGLPEPMGPTVELAGDDLVIVPGVAFDAFGVRLGLGGGYYDRTLAATSASAIGLAFDFQRVERLPREPWDQPVAGLVTERGAHDFAFEESQI